MPPAVIADSDEYSDDDSDERGYATPQLPQHTTPDVDAPTVSSDIVSHATASTDPALFQSVFNEQKDAANQRTQLAQGGFIVQAESVSSESTKQEACNIQQARSLSGPVPLTMSRKETSASKQTAEYDGVWDIPSSPERRSKSRVSKKKTEQSSKLMTVKVTRGLRKSLEKLGYESGDEDEISRDENISTGDKKRRKVATSRRRLNDDNEVSLNAVSSKNDSREAAQRRNKPLSDQEAASTTDANPSFLIDPGRLSASQKLEYQSIGLAPSSPSAQHSELKARDMASSGTATNINTPRSNLPSSHDVGMRVPTPESEAVHNKRARSPRRRRDSSPDVLLHAKIGGTRVEAQPPAQSSNNSMPSGDIDGAAEYHQPECIPEQRDENSDDDFAIPETSPQPKKRRGRPRKNATVPENTATSRETDNGPTAEPKKKRGRPKKPSTHLDTSIEAVAPAAKSIDESTKRADVDDDDGCQKSAATTAQNASEVQNWTPKAANGQTGGSPNRSERDASVSSRPSTERAEISTKGVQTQEDRNNNRPSGPGVVTKPMYRVGLSKTRKIAPLLKSLRK